jgi:hypothetical protein
MPLGPNKYDRECAQARKDAAGSGAVLIILEGREGDGFAAHLNWTQLRSLPDTLRYMADEMEAKLKARQI